MLTVERSEIGAVTALRAAGEIEDEGVRILRDAILRCVADKHCNLVLNMSKVVYLSYMGAGALVESLGLVKQHHGDIKLTGMNIQSRRLLTTMGLGRVFESYESEMVAVKGYQQEAA
jgi:anti-anti-sigma factor